MSQVISIHNVTHYFFEIYFYIILPPTLLSSPHKKSFIAEIARCKRKAIQMYAARLPVVSIVDSRESIVSITYMFRYQRALVN
jgi:hypothetical protein